MCGICPDVVDGCSEGDCNLRTRYNRPDLQRYITWFSVGDPYCEHLVAKHGHFFAEWDD